MEPRESGTDESPRAGSLTIGERLGGFYTRRPAAAALLVTLFIVVFLLLPLWWMAGTWYEEQLISEERNVVAVDLSKYGSQLSQALSRRVSLVEGLSAFVLSDPSQETLTRTYDSFAAGLYTATPGIRNFGVAPGGVQTYVYPLKGNENVPGHNLLTDNRSDVQKYNKIAIETKKTVIRGPHELRQGGLGLVITDALFVNNTFWGFCSMAVDMPPILAEAGLSGQTGDLTLAVKNHDGTVFYGDPGLFAGDAVIQQFPVGTGVWEIAGKPAGGWSAPVRRPLFLFNITGLVILGLIAGLVFLITKTYISVVIDISERKRVEAALQLSEEKFSMAFRASPDVLVISRQQDGLIIDVNDSWEHTFGYSRAESIGKTSLALGVFVNPDQRQQAFSRLQQEGSVRDFEVEIKRKSGEIRHATLSVEPIELNKESCMLTILRDITERERAELELVSAQENLKEAHRLAHIGVWDWVMENDTVTWSEELFDIAGRDPSLQAPTYAEHPRVYTPASWDRLSSAVSRALTTSEPYNLELELVRPDGSTRWVNAFGGVKHDGKGKVIGLHGTVQDITGRKKAELELQNSLSFLNSLVDQSPLPMWISDEKGTLIRINPACCDLLKITQADVVGKYNIFSDNLVVEQGFLPIVRDVFLKGQPANFQITYDTQKLKTLELDRHTSVILDVTIFPVKDASGKITNAVIQHVDITERKMSEEALRVVQEKYSKAFLSAPDAITISELDSGRFIEVNEAATAIFGYSREEMIGKSALELGIWQKKEDRAAFVDQIKEHGRVYQYEITERRKSGELFNALVNADTLSIGDLNHLIAIIRDITDSKQAEDALKKSRVQLAEAMDLAKLVNWEFEVATGIFTFDDRFYALYGTTAEREGGNKMPAEVYAREFVHPDDRHVVAGEVKKAIEATDPGFISQVEHRIIRRDGEIRHIVVRFGITKDANGRTIKTHGANQDITERRLMEEKIRSLNTTLEQRVQERTRQLNTSLDEKVLLLREIHHRVKNNLQIIISLLSLQSRYIGDEKTSQLIKESQNRVRAMALVHEKLHQSTDIAHIDLDNYIRFLGNSLFEFYGMKGTGILLNTRIHDINVDIDTAIPIGLIVNELVSNSIKHAFPDGRRGEISIAIQRQDHTLTLLYKDTGVGIPQDFDWRNAKSLGLRLVISLVEQLFGTIELDRTAGTTFNIVVKEKE